VRVGRREAAAAVAVAALLAAPGARAETVDDNPSASSRHPGQVSVFLRGTDAALHHATLRPDRTWTPWASLGGILSSGPGASARLQNVTDVFVRGADNALFQKTWLDASYTGWVGFPDQMLSAPAVAPRQGPAAELDLVYRGTDNSIVQRTWTQSGGWSAAHSLGGQTLAAPAIVSRGGGLVDVFVRGTTDLVYRNAWNGSAWSGWQAVDGSTTTNAAPAVSTRGSETGTMDLFVRSARSGATLWKTFTDASGWTG
jgi:hypothetical protein